MSSHENASRMVVCKKSAISFRPSFNHPGPSYPERPPTQVASVCWGVGFRKSFRKGATSPPDEQTKAVWTTWKHHSVDPWFPHSATAATHCRWGQIRRFRCLVRSSSGHSDGTTFIPTVHKWPTPLSSILELAFILDDCLVYRPIKTLEDQRQFQRDQYAMSRLGQLWGMNFNAKKCHIMSSPLSKFYQLDDTILSHVDSATYLGILLHKSLSFSDHIQDTANKCSRRLGFLRRNLRGCP